MSKDLLILKQLSDGRFHSGESLAELLGVSRTTVWKVIQTMQEEYDVQIQSVKGRGYRLARPLELFDEQSLLAKLNAQTRVAINRFEILQRVDSTNRYLMAAASQGGVSGHLVLAEQQTAGRGRRSRKWVSPFGCNIYLSLLWRFNLASSELAGLGIVVAVALARALSTYSENIRIKWPNDIYWQGRKLAGILLEMQGEANGPATVVIGLGVNVDMAEEAGADIDQAWTDLRRATTGEVSRNGLAASIIDQLIAAIVQFETAGLPPFIRDWQAWDMLYNQPVDLALATQSISGIARGIGETGALRVETETGMQSFMAGEASLRKPVRS